MNRLPLLGLLLLALALPAQAQRVTGLSGWSLYLDPGHSENENVGVYGYSEARKTLRVALALRDLLVAQTDIAAVYTSRTTDAQQVSLSQRTDDANARAVSFFHSIHSDAGGPTSNSTLLLYGGWRRNGQTVEKTPTGGRALGDQMDRTLTAAMRIGRRGNFADRTFYLGFPDNHDNQFPYLHVNRETNMASLLSEAGFHTNPRQNQLNMNADWKRLEAQAMFWSILDFHGLARPEVYIATGIVTDAESGRPVNGAVVTVGSRSYTTDTYASLFNQYSSDPNELANGFYYLDGLTAGTLPVSIAAPGYRPYTGSVAMTPAALSFHDAALVSALAPVVAASVPAAGATGVRFNAPLTLTFSRPMDAATTAPALSLVAAGGAPVAGAATWSADGYTLTFTPSSPLAPETAYTLTLAGTATGRYGDALDGNRDGTPGDAFTLSFTTGGLDVAAPRLTESSPRVNATGVDLRPLVTVAFDEVVVPASLTSRVRLTVATTGAVVPSRLQTSTVAGRTTVSLVPDAELLPSTSYRLAVDAGVVDLAGNATASGLGFNFITGTTRQTVTVLESFDGGVASWWQPQQSGSTVGIVTDSTSLSAVTDLVSPAGGTGALRLDYGWAETGPWLIREYLGGGPLFSANFSPTATLQATVYSDGSGTLFRFAVDDGCSGSTCTGTEVGPWVPLTWRGWRTVAWNMATEVPGAWIGNGTLDGRLRFDSFQLAYAGTGPRFGAIRIDDLQLVQLTPVAGDGAPGDVPALALLPAQPNPSRGATSLGFTLGAPASVTLRVFNLLGQEVAVLAEAQPFAAGTHRLRLDGRALAAGVYLARVEAAGTTATARFTITR